MTKDEFEFWLETAYNAGARRGIDEVKAFKDAYGTQSITSPNFPDWLKAMKRERMKDIKFEEKNNGKV